MKKKNSFILILSALLLVGCNGQEGHVHEWDSFFDNGDGTHSAVCHTDCRHTITDEHHYGDSIIIKEPSKIDTGIKKYTCKECGSVKLETIPSEGENNFVNEIVDEKYLYTSEGVYGNTYYKSSDDGSFGDDSALFEYSQIPEGYSEVKYIKGDGVHTVDTGIKSDTSMIVSNNVYTSTTGKTSRLPSGYQEVEYVQSTGLEYIDLQLPVNYTDSVTQITDMQYLTYDHQQWMGADWYGQISAYYFNTTERINVESKYTKNGTFAVFLNGSQVITKDFSQYKKTNVKYGLFRLGTENNTWYHPETMEINTIAKVYSEQIYINDVLMRDLVPCVNTYTSEVGVFDLVTKTFFGNEGEGELIAGEVVSPITPSRLPIGYQEVEYIQGTGTQWIDTRFSTTEGMICEYKANWQTPGYVVGSHSENSPYGRNSTYLNNADSGWEFGYGEICPHFKSPTGQNLNQDYVIKFSTLFDNAWAEIDGNLLYTSSGEHTSPNTVKMFVCDYSFKTKTPAILYYCKIWDALNNLVRDYVPCIKTNTLEVGLYDLVNKEFYSNDGEGEFIAGNPIYNPITPSSRLPRGYLEVEYIDQINAGPDEKYDQNCIELPNLAYTKIETKMSTIGKGSSGGIILSGTSADWFLQWDNNPMHIDFLGAGNSGYVYPSTMNEDSWTSIVLTFDKSVTGLRTAGWIDDINYWCPQSVKISYLKAYNGDLLVGNFVPCVREKDGEVGLYDLVNDEFYSNVGPDEFEVGDYVSTSSVTTRLPSMYQEIEYVESTGKQCIDTGVIPDGTLATEIVIQENMDAIGENAIFGSDWKTNGYFLMAYNNNLRFHSSGYMVDTIGMSDGQMKIYTFSKAITEYILIVDDVPALNSQDTGFVEDIQLPIKLFDVSNEVGNPGSFKLYSFKMSKGGVLVRDFVPCISKITGEIGLYDLVSKEFFPNIGEEELIAGPYVNISEHASGVGNIEIFKDNILGSESVYSSKLFNLVLSEDSGKITHEFVAVVRDSDSKAGFIDLNTNQFVELPEGDFEVGPIVGHVFGDSVVIKEATYNSKGESFRICDNCGVEEHTIIPCLSWKIDIEYDEGIEKVEVYKNPYEIDYSDSLVAYTRSMSTYVYTKIGSGIFLKITYKDGYELDEILGLSDLEFEVINDCLVISGFNKDQTINIISKQKA